MTITGDGKDKESVEDIDLDNDLFGLDDEASTESSPAVAMMMGDDDDIDPDGDISIKHRTVLDELLEGRTFDDIPSAPSHEDALPVDQLPDESPTTAVPIADDDVPAMLETPPVTPPATTVEPLSVPKEQVYAVRGRVVTPHKMIIDGAVVIAGDAIAWIGESTQAASAGFGDEVLQAEAPTDDRYILPGLVDIHNHGGGGKLFPGVQTYDDVMTAVNEHRQFGTTTLVASLVSASPLVLRERAELLADACDNGELAGIHFEGPFLGVSHCGVQDPVHIQSPNPALARELMVVSRGHCVSMTVAPEKPYTMGPSGVVETLIDGGAVPSFGHMDARGDQMRKALREVREKLLAASSPRSGQATITHMFNGMAPAHHRKPGPVFEILADAAGGGAVCEVIGDGVHVAPEFVRTTYELIGREQIALVSNSVSAGAPDGDYVLGTVPITIRDGRALTADGRLGGGGSHLIDVVRTTHEGGIPLIDAIYCASAVPARVLGDSTIGAIEVGKQADLLITDALLNPIGVIRRGEKVK